MMIIIQQAHNQLISGGGKLNVVMALQGAPAKPKIFSAMNCPKSEIYFERALEK